MKKVFDVIEAINDKVTRYHQQTGLVPSAISISPRFYRQLVEIKSWEQRIGNLVIGCVPIKEIETLVGKVQIILDEILSDTAVEIAS